MTTDVAQKILIVEDEFIIALAVRRTLEGFGYKVAQASSGAGAVEMAAASQDISLILMDINLGEGMDGTEAARQILLQRNVPIIFHTSHSERAMVEKVRAISRYGYVVKNSSDFVLRSSIEMAFELFEAHRKWRNREESLLRAEGIAEFGSWDLDLKSGVFTVSDGATAIYGKDSDDLSHEAVQSVPCAEYRARLDAALKGLVEEGRPYALGFEIVRPSEGGHAFIYWRRNTGA